MDPTLHYKMKSDEADDGSSEGAADPMRTQRPVRRKQEHRNRQLPTLIVNIETDVQAE